MKALLRIIALWRRHAPALLAGAVVSVAAMGAAVALMTISAGLVAGMVAGGAAATGLALAAPPLLRLLGPARVVLRYLERLVTHDAMFRALSDLRVWFFRGLAARAAGGLGFRRAGDVLARLVGDVQALDGLYLRVLVPLASAVVLLPVLVWRIWRDDPSLAAGVGALFVLSAFVLPLLAARATREAGARLSAAASGMRVAALDTLAGLREVRAYSAEGRMLATVQSREAALFAAQHAVSRRAALAGAAAFLCGQAAVLAVLMAAGASAETVVLAFLTVAAFEVIAGLPRAGALAGHAAEAAARVTEAAEGRVELPDPSAPAALPPGTALRFEAVQFRWQPDRPPVFDGLTLDIPAGSRVALIGPSGSGKSTFAALALKVVAPQHGHISLGGADIATLAAADVRSRIGWLSQATHLFDDTIRANLKLARPAADDAALWAALEAARIAEFVRGLPDRLDSWVGEGGAGFSGGQGRRLALARALLSPAPVLILDEPCAGLDAETERAFFATLNEAAGTRTVVLIAHRLTGVERLDRIWRLSRGRAVAAAA
jgi:ATP-binding cassette, subfamily C, bacterial CydC